MFIYITFFQALICILIKVLYEEALNKLKITTKTSNWNGLMKNFENFKKILQYT